VLASTTVVELIGAEAAEVVVAATKALASKVSALAGEGPLLLAAALLGLLFPAQSAVVWLEIFLPLPFTWPHALAWVADVHFPGEGALARTHDCFDFFLKILLQVLLDFDGLVLVWG
jgi:hypothetical protein